MAKILLDKYYTPPDLAEYIVNKTKLIIGEENISEYLKPSAGTGVFLDYLDKPYLAYDIEPDDKRNRIVKRDFLELDLDYKKGRCVIGNPPFGEKNNLTVSFYKKLIHICDYISFILPISQYKNDIKLYEFDLIYSEDLGIYTYTDINIHCCLNIFNRPINNILNKKANNKLKDVEIIEIRLGNKQVKDYDIRICAWGGYKDGNSGIGNEVKYENQYAKEFCIKVYNEKYKNEIIELIKNADWRKLYPMTASPNLTQWQVYKYIKEQIPEIS